MLLPLKQGLWSFASFCREFWLLLCSVALVALAIVVWILNPEPLQLEQAGSYISGIVSAITLLWLAAGLRIQSQELSLQRQELRLQRIAAEQQAQELHKAAKIGSLTQIQSLLDDADRLIEETDLPINSDTQFMTLIMTHIELWKVIDESKSAEEVTQAYGKWLSVEALCRNYLRFISAALKLYVQYNHPNAQFDFSKSDQEFVYIYSSWGNNAPFLSHRMGCAAMLAQNMFMIEPGMKRMRLASFVAHAKMAGKNIFKEGALEEMRAEVFEHNVSLPAICNPWPFQEAPQENTNI